MNITTKAEKVKRTYYDADCNNSEGRYALAVDAAQNLGGIETSNTLIILTK